MEVPRANVPLEVIVVGYVFHCAWFEMREWYADVL